MKKLRSVIIGCGDIAGGYDQAHIKRNDEKWVSTHAGAYQVSKRSDLVAVCDHDPKISEKFSEYWKVENFFTDYKIMLHEIKPDIVSICSPTTSHKKIFLDCLTNNNIRGIFLEKPISESYYDSTEMLKALVNTDKKVLLNFSRRFNKDFARLKTFIDKKVFGKPLKIIFRYTKGLKVNGSHLIDIALWFFGNPSKIEVLNRYKSSSSDSGFDFKFFYDDFEVIFIHIPDEKFVLIDFDFIFEDARLVLNQRGQAFELHKKEVDPFFQKFNILSLSENYETKWKNQICFALDNLIDAINDESEIICSIENGIKVDLIINNIFEGIYE